MKIRTMVAGAVCLYAALSASATEWTYSESTSSGGTKTTTITLVTNIVRYVSGTADQTGCRVYVSKRQWTKEARDAATYSADENPAGYFAGMGTFTENEKEKIAEDSTLAKAYGVLVVGGVRKAFVVNKASPHDKVTGLMIIIQ